MAVAVATSVVATLNTRLHLAAPCSFPHSAAFSTSNPQFRFQSLDSAYFVLGSSFKTNPLIKKSLSLHKKRSAQQGPECRSPRASAFPLSWEDTSGPSLYAILGIEQTVEIPEIKRAYRNMASRYHPDVCPAADVALCTEKFLQLQNAYKMLSDPELRAHYDHHMTTFTRIGFRRSGSLRSEVVREHWMRTSWKPQWEAQVGKLRWRHAASAQERSHSSTWGERTRRQNRLNYGAL
ncbi:hypothetical protein O6H91_Y336300 [Diphasiastrum complanatum]|nr:hypothetical protein O6H91_Y336300 [Diphasiastrum complanatum]